ncbi:MAG TPA: hypothetical protein VKV80_06385 [Streptosporangiaceae bacterium]|jgi:hypothetical protein|nr:hypothetical protein [Streptosporangiaceae bacterium]
MAEDAPKGKEQARSSARGGTEERHAGGGREEMTIRLPSLDDMRRGVTPERVLWYGGLGALAAFGVIDWPVAAVVGAGTYVARRMARREAAGEHRPPGG